MVEDNPADADLAIEWLGESGRFAVHQVRSLAEAVTWLQGNVCDVTMLDLHLPDSQGLETLLRIKTFHPDLPVLVVSGTEDQSLREELIRAGATEVLTKQEMSDRWLSLAVLYVAAWSRAREQQAQIAKILDTALDAIIVVDESGEVQHVNQGALTLFDRKREDFAEERLLFSLEEGSSAELMVHGPAGSKIGEMRVTEFGWAGRRSFLASIRDVTQQRNMERQLLLADKLSALGTIAAGLAHEINNPLAAVLGNIEFSLCSLDAFDAGDEKLRPLLESLQDAREAADRMRQIVQDVKLFSRAEDSPRRLLDLHQVLDSATRMAWNEIRGRARLVKDYGDLPEIESNETQLIQVFLNLLVNAGQAIGKGNPERDRIRIFTAVDEQRRVVIEISDTGPGMNAEVQRNLFTAFFTTKPVGEGTGLGLSICKRIIEGLGGRISFTSEPGQGTTFRISFPCPRPEPAAGGPIRRETAGPERRGLVLVVDDSAQIGQTLERILGREHDVKWFSSAQAAIDYLEAGHVPDLILADIHMPEMNGLQFHEEVRRRPGTTCGNFLFMTGPAPGDGIESLIAARGLDCIRKPFEVRSIRATVNALIR
ncbi:MAG: response regulator [Planctomycetes bacterium]|nr:response regulator [Planctomycetota bacterium]